MEAKENPFLKPQSSNFNLDFNKPQNRYLGLTSEQRVSDPLLLKSNVIEAEKEEAKEAEALAKVFSEANNINTANYSNNQVPVAPQPTNGAQYVGDTGGPSSSAQRTGMNGAKVANVTGAVVGEAPNIVNNFSSKPTSEKEATGKVLSMTASGASIGTAIMPGWGTLIGAGVGAIGGLIGNIGWKGKLAEQQETDYSQKLEQEEAERAQNYFLNKTAEQIKAERDLFAEAQGIYN